MEDSVTEDAIVRWYAGDGQALRELMPLIYDELRRVARRHLRGHVSHTLQTTALINEAYMRLAESAKVSVRDQRHFVALASRVMRQILVDHSRKRSAAKRHPPVQVTLSEAANVAETSVDVVAVDEALDELARLDEQQARIVELRFFGGMSILETAEALQISPATVSRDWTMARVWLRGALRLQAGT